MCNRKFLFSSAPRLRMCLPALLCIFYSTALADRIVVSNDEWPTTNVGFGSTPAGSAQFAINVAKWLTNGSGSGDFLVYSDDFALAPNQATTLASTLGAAGYVLTSYTSVGGFTFDLPTLLGFSGVFLGCSPVPNNAVLTSYVNAGGSVLLEGGTGCGGPAVEAANWNGFLNSFGLQFESTYNGIAGNIAISNPFGHPVLNGVTALYQNNGNSISYFGANPNAKIIESLGDQGLYAVYDLPSVSGVPEPRTLWLLATIVALMAGVRHLALASPSPRRAAPDGTTRSTSVPTA
jgi:hypothetical protein